MNDAFDSTKKPVRDASSQEFDSLNTSFKQFALEILILF